MGLPGAQPTSGPDILAEYRNGVLTQFPGQYRRPEVCPTPSPLGVSYKADADAIRDSRKLYDCPPGFGTGHFDPASLIKTTPDGSNRALYSASLLAAHGQRQSFGSPIAQAAPPVAAAQVYGWNAVDPHGPLTRPEGGGIPAPSIGAVNSMMDYGSGTGGGTYSAAFRHNTNSNQQYNGGGTMTVQNTYTEHAEPGGSGGGQPPGGQSNPTITSLIYVLSVGSR